VVALVGESGSGKTTLGLASIGLLAPNAVARFDRLALGGVEIAGWRDPAWNDVRGTSVALVPQDPGVSLNPVRTIGSQAIEHLVVHRLASRQKARQVLVALLEEVGLDHPEERLGQYPHELSGGQQQRVLLAMAFSSDPKLVVADEPTSGLDVTVQRAVLDRFDRLRTEHGTAVLFITHDLGVAVERADRIVVLQRGRIVEQGAARALVESPRHEYTRELIAAAPSFASRRLRPSPGVEVRAEAKHADGRPVLVVEGVRKAFRRGRTVVDAVDGISFDLRRAGPWASSANRGAGSRPSPASSWGSSGPTPGRSPCTASRCRTAEREPCGRTGITCSSSIRTRTSRSTRSSACSTRSRSRS
jgi:peptide/nickel transport system ATP-binding protein